MTPLHQTISGYSPRLRCRRWLRYSIAALLGTGLTVSAFAQDDDPDNLTVPESLKNATENSSEQNEADPDAQRVRIGQDAQQERVVGRLVSIEGNTLTIADDDDRQQRFQVPSGVKVTRNGDRVPLRQLLPNDVVRIERGVAPDSVTAVVAVSPAPTGDREPDEQLRSQRRQEADQEPRARVVQEAVPAAGGRVWVVLMESNTELAQSGLRPGDVIVVADRSMLQGEGALEGLSSGLFPLRTNQAGEVIISPNAAGAGILGAGGAVPTGVNIGVGPGGRNIDPRSGGANPNTAIPPRSSVGDENFGPPIGRRQNPEDRNFGPSSDPQDRNFGPPIGTGNNPAQGAGQPPQAQQPQQPQQQPQQAPPAP